jgi:hypothetical protein
MPPASGIAIKWLCEYFMLMFMRIHCALEGVWLESIFHVCIALRKCREIDFIYSKSMLKIKSFIPFAVLV